MTRLKLPFCFFAISLFATFASAETADQLVADSLENNPELRFYTTQVAALPKPAKTASPTIPFPLGYPSREKLRAAVLNFDAELSRFYLAEYRFVLAGTVRLKAMEYQAITETLASATDLASRTGALVTMLKERPAAGVSAVIERRILEGAALPYIGTAAEAEVLKKVLAIELNGLLGRDANATLTVEGSLSIPPDIENATGDSLIIKTREAELARGLTGLNAAAEVESFAMGPWFTREGLGANDAVIGAMRPGVTAGSDRNENRLRLLSDARAKLEREIAIRQAALTAARKVSSAMPEDLIANLKAASDLAERQYRVGALGVNILVEAQREYLSALETRNKSLTQAWRNMLDLQLLKLPTPNQSTGKTQ